MQEKSVPFVTYLMTLPERDDRGALAALRRGLGQPPGMAHEMYPYVVPWLPKEGARWREDVYFVTAALFALHPTAGGVENMGAHFARTCEKDDDSTAVERRFSVLLSAHREDLPDHLRQAVSYLRTKEVPVNWHRLFADIQNWGHPSGYVQREWARAFWGRTPPGEAN